jgi:hypothetical protein
MILLVGEKSNPPVIVYQESLYDDGKFWYQEKTKVLLFKIFSISTLVISLVIILGTPRI